MKTFTVSTVKKLFAVTAISLGSLVGAQAFASANTLFGIDLDPIIATQQVIQPVAKDPTALPYTKAFKDNFHGMPLYLVTMKNGKLDPYYLVVPANKPFRILAVNIGSIASEFESRTLHFEKALYPKTGSTVFILPKPVGQYDYYDDFTPGRSGYIIAK